MPFITHLMILALFHVSGLTYLLTYLTFSGRTLHVVDWVSGGNVTTDCQLPVDVGPCFAYQIRWYHDPSTLTCRQFHYGGCQGNANNFYSLDDCQTACIDQPADVTSVKPNGTR